MHFIADYSGDSEDSAEETSKTKRKDEINTTEPESTAKKLKTEKGSLPLPLGIKSMFKEDAVHSDDQRDHGGRIRSFAHERGNWASYVYIPIGDLCMELLRDLTQVLLSEIKVFADFHMSEDFHISLSRTFIIKHHWISPLVTQLQNGLAACKPAKLHFTTLKLYTNDEKTRTFIGLCVGGNLNRLQLYTHKIDGILKQYQLPKYYEDPSFHISLAWAVGDVMTNLNDANHKKVQAMLEDHSKDDLDILGQVDVSTLKFKTGNKVFDFPLTTS